MSEAFLLIQPGLLHAEIFYTSEGEGDLIEYSGLTPQVRLRSTTTETQPLHPKIIAEAWLTEQAAKPA